MKLYRFNNSKNDEWLNKYNEVIRRYETGQKCSIHECSQFSGDGVFDSHHLTLHHIIPRSVDISLKNDKRNHIYLNFYDHAMMHYYLWKHDSKYAKQLWFMATYGRKHNLWDFPEGDKEYNLLKQHLRK